jgi:nitrogen fixation NifU-like protein
MSAPTPPLNSLYQTLILEHYRHPRNRGELPDKTVEVHMANPVCGDEIRLQLKLEDDVIRAIRFAGQGCSISQASVSMMSVALTGRTLEDALETVEHFRQVMHGDEAADEERLGDAIALEGVAKYPVRVKCALLGWMAAKDAIQTYQSNGNGEGVE